MNSLDMILDSLLELGKSVVAVLGPLSLAIVAAGVLMSWICSMLNVQDHSLGVCVRWAVLLSMLWYFAADGFHRIKEQTLSQWEEISIVGKSSNP